MASMKTSIANKSFSADLLFSFVIEKFVLQIRSKVETSTVTNAEYREVQIDIWQSFYTNVAQYHQVAYVCSGLN